MPAAPRRTPMSYVPLTQPQIAFATEKDPDVALGMIQIGFEQETQRFADKSYSDASNQEEEYTTDHILRRQMIMDATLEIMGSPDICFDFFENHYHRSNQRWREAVDARATELGFLIDGRYNSVAGIHSNIDLVLGLLRENVTINSLVDAGLYSENSRAILAESWWWVEQVDTSAMRHAWHTRNPEFISHTVEGYFRHFAPGVSPKLKFELDSSVGGPEIMPSRPLDYNECAPVLESLFKYPMTVNTNCSFHVHISVKDDREMGYHRNLQLFMLEYLLSHLDEVPESVRERWQKSSWMNKYFKIKNGVDKYSFIAFRREHSSWEFRCFGNIHNAADAMKCIDLTVKAYRYAILRALKSESSIVVSRPSNRAFNILRETLQACFDQKDTTVFASEYQKISKSKKKFKEPAVETARLNNISSSGSQAWTFGPLLSVPGNTGHNIRSILNVTGSPTMNQCAEIVSGYQNGYQVDSLTFEQSDIDPLESLLPADTTTERYRYLLAEGLQLTDSAPTSEEPSL